MITPVNGHLLIEPLKHETFVSSGKEVYEEIGIVTARADELADRIGQYSQIIPAKISVGDKVFFDSWTAAKHIEGEKTYWLVKWSDVRAIEKNGEIPTEPMSHGVVA